MSIINCASKDCAYQKDGKCGYDVVLPMTMGAGGNETCIYHSFTPEVSRLGMGGSDMPSGSVSNL